MGEHAITLSLEILSPCFLGGAHQQPEFRVGSLRGLWRYWYRALYGRGDERNAAVEGEVALFGDTSRRGAARLLARPDPGLLQAGWRRGAGTGADYLLFTMDMNRRSYVRPGARIPLELRVGGDERALERAARSLVTALSFGGIGARARRMAGATHLVVAGAPGPAESVVPAGPADDPAALAARLRALVAPVLDRPVTRPRFPLVARKIFAAGVLSKTFADWRSAMDAVGAQLRQFRYRKEPDYTVARRLADGQRPDPGTTVTRAAFGLPIAFRFRSLGGRGVTVQLSNADRRGSPLFLTLERLEGGQLAVVWCLFRGPLSPDDRLRVRSSGVDLPAPGLEVVDAMLGTREWASHRIVE